MWALPSEPGGVQGSPAFPDFSTTKSKREAEPQLVEENNVLKDYLNNLMAKAPWEASLGPGMTQVSGKLLAPFPLVSLEHQKY